MLEKTCHHIFIRQSKIGCRTRNANRVVKFPTVLHGVEHSVALGCGTPFPGSNLPCAAESFIGKGNLQRNPCLSIALHVKKVGCIHHGLSGFLHGHTRIERNKDMPRNCDEPGLDSNRLKKRADQNRNVIAVSTTVCQSLVGELEKVY